MSGVRILGVAIAALTLATGAAAASPPNDYGPLPTISAPSADSRIEGRLSTAAAKITGHATEVRCWSRADWERLDIEWQAWTSFTLADKIGYADPKNGRVHLAPKACASLVPFLYRNARPKVGTIARQNLALAMVAVAHESHHVAGIADEAKTECYAQQRIRPLARVLGASKDYAAGLAVFAWRVLYAPLPPSYKNFACRNGGPWDLNPASPSWP